MFDFNGFNQRSSVRLDLCVQPTPTADAHHQRTPPTPKRDAHRAVEKMSPAELAALKGTIAKVENQNESKSADMQPSEEAV